MTYIDFLYEGAVDIDDNFLRVCNKEVFTVLYLSRRSKFVGYLRSLDDLDRHSNNNMKNYLAG